MDQKKRKLLVKGMSCLALALLLTGQVMTASAKAKKEKLKSATGIIMQVNEQGNLVVRISKNKEKSFIMGKSVIVLQEQLIGEQDLQLKQTIRIKGKGQHSNIVANKITLLNEQSFKTINSKKTGTVYGERKKNTEIKGSIIGLSPLTVKNYYNQKVSVDLTDQVILVKQLGAKMSDVQDSMKVKVNYVKRQGQLIAQKIILPYVMKKQAKK